ncbi:SBDS protein C-terminal domain-containing protein [Flagelloscypha sp. PMI_526]|nr:SBDS protein C-terminal domain-containing protein [Flagelloscypha sp. PMI_526]
MSKINQPSNQIKLTNVSIVRLKKGGKRFEIACYKNKVQEWRNGVETALDEVLQISNVFVNVSKGQAAKTQELSKAFGTSDMDKIVKEILNKGEVQVGEKERDHDLTSLRKEIATQVSLKSVDPSTQRPYPVGVIEKALNEAGFSVRQGKPAKSQVSEAIKLIQTSKSLPIERAKMKIRVSIPKESAVDTLKTKIVELGHSKEDEKESGDDWEVTLLIDPASFRTINELLQKEVPKGRGRIEAIDFAATTTTTASSTASA